MRHDGDGDGDAFDKDGDNGDGDDIDDDGECGYGMETHQWKGGAGAVSLSADKRIQPQIHTPRRITVDVTC